MPPERITDLLRAAGLFRVRQKAERWHWRRRAAGAEQVSFGNKVVSKLTASRFKAP
jgi:hypothetical protein